MSRFDTGSHRLQLATISAAAVIGLGVSSASAIPIPFVTMEWFASNDNVPHPSLYIMHEHSDQMNPLGGGTYQFLGSQFGEGAAWELNWDMTANANPIGMGAGGGNGSAFVTADLAVTNTSSSFQSFWALVTLSLDSPIIGGTLMNGQVSAGVTDFLGTGAELRTLPDNPIYTSFIDGAAQQTLLDDPFSLVANPFSSNSTSTDFGNPNPLVGPDALNSISVWLQFDLSPGDTANVVGTFEIMAIPAPAALPLLAALGLLAGRRRRRC